MQIFLVLPLPGRKQWHRGDIQKLWRHVWYCLRMLLLEITGIIRKEGAWSMYLVGIYEAMEDLTSWRVEVMLWFFFFLFFYFVSWQRKWIVNAGNFSHRGMSLKMLLLKITGIIRKGAWSWSMYLVGIYEAVPRWKIWLREGKTINKY